MVVELYPGRVFSPFGSDIFICLLMRDRKRERGSVFCAFKKQFDREYLKNGMLHH